MLSKSLFVKVGNSRVVAWNGKRTFALKTDEVSSQKILKAFAGVEKIWLISVVPEVSKKFRKDLARRKLPLLHVSAKDIPLKPAYSKGIGIDRLLNIYAAKHITPESFVVMDMGTAVTVDFFHKKKGHLGGWIAAGPALMGRILSQGTAQLPEISLSAKDQKMRLGKNTAECLKAGQIAMMRGLQSEATDEAKRLLGKKFLFICTGGWAEIFALPGAKRVPNLGLLGLKYLSQTGA